MKIEILEKIQMSIRIGRTPGYIRQMYHLTEEETFAIIDGSDGVSNEQILERLPLLKAGMKSAEIIVVMHGKAE